MKSEVQNKESTENHQNECENIGTQMPVILAIDADSNKRRGRRKYTTSEKVVQRNRIANAASVKKLKENQEKLKEYEILKKTKTLTKEEADELLSTKLSQVEAKLDEIANKQIMAVPPILKPIQEDSSGYSSSDSQKRVSERFSKRDVSPQVSRLSERFKRF